jgi:hypothetical protein
MALVSFDTLQGLTFNYDVHVAREELRLLQEETANSGTPAELDWVKNN